LAGSASVFYKEMKSSPLHTPVNQFFLEKYDEKCCRCSLGISPDQDPLVERMKDLDRHLEKRASAWFHLIIIHANSSWMEQYVKWNKQSKQDFHSPEHATEVHQPY
jgi:hypothetical protein